jgi:hypothetical protein
MINNGGKNQQNATSTKFQRLAQSSSGKNVMGWGGLLQS